MQEQIRLKKYLLTKLGTGTFILIYFFIGFLMGDFNLGGFIATNILISVSALSGIFLWNKRAENSMSSMLSQLSMCSDVVLLTLVLYYLGGGLKSTWLLLTVIPIFMAGYLFLLRTSVICATFSFLTILFLFTMEYFRLIPNFGTYSLQTDILWESRTNSWENLVSIFFLYYLSALSSGYLGQRIANSQESLRTVNAQLAKAMKEIDYEMKMATVIQRSMLPDNLERLTGIQVAQHYIPCQSIGGDFYDVIEIDENITAFFIFDVVGHGVPAALVMTMARIAFTKSIARNPKPAAVLQNVSREIMEGLKEEKYLTAFIGFFNKSTRQFTCARAGHPMPIIVDSDTQDLELIDIPGLSIGFLTGIEYVEKSYTLKKGDKVIMYTDGLVEGLNAQKEFYGRERFYSAIKKFATQPAEALKNKLVSDHQSFVGLASQNDDIALLILEITA